MQSCPVSLIDELLIQHFLADLRSVGESQWLNDLTLMLGINSCFMAQPSRRVTQWYFPGNTMVKNTPAKRHVYNPWVGKIPWSRKWQSTPVFLAGKFHGERTLAGYNPWVCKESDLTEHTHTHISKDFQTSLFCFLMLANEKHHQTG